jgi:DNA primase
VERILLRALVLPEADSARALAAAELGAHPDWFAELASARGHRGTGERSRSR